jgi:polysaccharide biosynthesis/export protein
VPIIDRLFLKNPASLFFAQEFPMSNPVHLNLSNAVATQMRKFLNLLFTVIYSVSALKEI